MNDERSMRERMLAGDLYLAEDPELAADAARARSLTHRFNHLDPGDPDAAATARDLLTRLLGRLGAGSEIRAPFRCDYGYRTEIGERVFANFGLICLDVAQVIIGDDVQLGPNVALLTPRHPVAAEPRRQKWESAAPITIGANAWLGGGVTVLGGVRIGADAVVGAGSVVTRDVPPGVVVVGNPARVVRAVPPT